MSSASGAKLEDILYPPPIREGQAGSLAAVPPKVLGDVFESILGAIYIDSDGDTALCERFVKMALLEPYLDDALATSIKKRWSLHVNPTSIVAEVISLVGCVECKIDFVKVAAYF